MINKFLSELEAKGTPEKALADQKYHKSKRVHFGVPVPESRKLIGEWIKKVSEEELFKMAEALWRTDLYDPMICATIILSHRKIKPSLRLWKTIVRFLKDVDGWALEDQLAHAAWKCILNDEKLLDEVETWTEHPNFWMRRAALIYTLPYAKPGKDPERSLKWASKYVADPEWFIQKAIGWWLRDLSQHNPKRVLTFLRKYDSKLKYVAKKEATRKMAI